MDKVQCVVIGAGVVGLPSPAAGAGRARGHHPGGGEGIGNETSSRNSEVIHAGIYYPTGSLKARMCVRGKRVLYAIAATTACRIKCGKLIVATTPSETAKLQSIRAHAEANGVNDLQPLRRCGARAGAGAELRRRAALAFDRHHRQPRLHAGAAGDAEEEGAAFAFHTPCCARAPAGRIEFDPVASRRSAGMPASGQRRRA